MPLREECTECDFEDVWDGGPEAEDPGVEHAEETGHTVRTRIVNGS